MSDFLLLASWYLEASNWIAFAKAAFGVGLVIFVHELGHFLVAKACGVKCEKFYVGFDPPIRIGPLKLPRTLGKFQWGETEYGIGIIPLGGYVKMLGQDDNPANAAAEAERTRLRKAETAEGEEKREIASAEAKPESAEGVAQPQTAATRSDEFELDPRSYPAKSVPQRMAIISAGVTMNVITAVIFAALAYGIGVKHTPCIVGDIVPGDPAWESGLRPGDRIVRVGKEGEPSENLRWLDDLTKPVAFATVGDDLEMLVDRPGEEELLPITVVPHMAPGREIGSIGIIPDRTSRLAEKGFTVEGYPAAAAMPAFEGGDLIVAINGEPVEDGADWQALNLAHQDETITITVERQNGSSQEGGESTAQRVDIKVAPTPVRGLGIVFEMQPISGVRDGWPAEGILRASDIDRKHTGDLIRKVNGETVTDPLLLPHVLRRLAGQTVTLEIERENEIIEVQVTPILPTTYTAEAMGHSVVNVGSLGVVIPIKPVVAHVLPGSSADQAGLRPGDVLTKAQIIPTEDGLAAEKERGSYLDEIVLTDDPGNADNWLMVSESLTKLLPDTRVHLTWKRGDEEMEARLLPATIPGFFSPRRGLVFVGPSEIHRAGSAGEACALGFRQAKEDLLEIFTVIRLLFTGGLSVKALGGPGTIAIGATLEASEGVARLLLFMTLISMNLAVINFLPIPVLDGGHMVFLAYEGIRGKPVDEKIAFRLTLVGMSFILALMIFVLSLDALRIGKFLTS